MPIQKVNGVHDHTQSTRKTTFTPSIYPSLKDLLLLFCCCCCNEKRYEDVSNCLCVLCRHEPPIGPHSHEIRDVVSDRSSDSALFGTSFVVGIPTVVKKGTVPHTNNRNNYKREYILIRGVRRVGTGIDLRPRRALVGALKYPPIQTWTMMMMRNH